VGRADVVLAQQLEDVPVGLQQGRPDPRVHQRLELAQDAFHQRRGEQQQRRH